MSSGHSLFPEPGGMSLAGVIKNCVTGDGHNRSLGGMRQCTRAARQGVKQTGAVYYWTESKQNILLLVQCLISECITQDCGSGFSFCNAKDNEKKIKFLEKTQALWFKEGFRSSLILFPLLGII